MQDRRIAAHFYAELPYSKHTTNPDFLLEAQFAIKFFLRLNNHHVKEFWHQLLSDDGQ